ncbi:hypothetical protein LIA77_03402 [Sarocladium implicatum]|nr:hypothetical protein LIA77_03402 [Sarocladium implicatum]
MLISQARISKSCAVDKTEAHLSPLVALIRHKAARLPTRRQPLLAQEVAASLVRGPARCMRRGSCWWLHRVTKELQNRGVPIIRMPSSLPCQQRYLHMAVSRAGMFHQSDKVD